MSCQETQNDPLILPLEVLETPARTVVTINDERTEAIIHDSRQKVVIGCKRGPQGPKGDVGERSKAGWITYTSFVGNPKRAPVTFDEPFPNTDYSIVVSGKDVRQWSIEEQTERGFWINSNANKAISESVFWNATSKWG